MSINEDAMDLSLMARQARWNSERWFPVLHQKYGGSQLLSVFYALALGGEVGELQNLIKKEMREIGGGDSSKIEGEWADSFTYLLLLADELHINPLHAFTRKQEECEQRWGIKT